MIRAGNRMAMFVQVDQTNVVHQRQKGFPLVFLTRWHNSLIEVSFRGHVRTLQDGIEIPTNDEVVAPSFLLLDMSCECLVEIDPPLSRLLPVGRTRDIGANESARLVPGRQYSSFDGRTTLRQPEVDRRGSELGKYSTPRVTSRLDRVHAPSPVNMAITQHKQGSLHILFEFFVHVDGVNSSLGCDENIRTMRLKQVLDSSFTPQTWEPIAVLGDHAEGRIFH